MSINEYMRITRDYTGAHASSSIHRIESNLHQCDFVYGGGLHVEHIITDEAVSSLDEDTLIMMGLRGKLVTRRYWESDHDQKAHEENR